MEHLLIATEQSANGVNFEIVKNNIIKLRVRGRKKESFPDSFNIYSEELMNAI